MIDADDVVAASLARGRGRRAIQTTWAAEVGEVACRATLDRPRGDPPRPRAKRALVVLALALAASLGIATASWGERTDVVDAGDDTGTVPITPVVTLPGLPGVVDDRTLEDGWYLVVPTTIFTTEDEPLLQAARSLAIEARAVGYVDAKIILRRGGASKCTEHGCFDLDGGGGYLVVLKGPYEVSYGETASDDAELEAKLQWHHTTQAREVEEAASRGLTETPGIGWFDFPPRSPDS